MFHHNYTTMTDLQNKILGEIKRKLQLKSEVCTALKGEQKVKVKFEKVSTEMSNKDILDSALELVRCVVNTSDDASSTTATNLISGAAYSSPDLYFMITIPSESLNLFLTQDGKEIDLNKISILDNMN